MEKKLTLEDIRRIAEDKTKPIKPMAVKIPESVKKYDRIHLSQENTKRALQM
ncbi:MAG: hypothetical protein GX288_12355 [Clostridiales bacterium]|nr:hypothetical protein [Clostridiales bacterium]